MQLFVEVVFYSNERECLPVSGYRPDAVFNKRNDYWGIVFTDLSPERFDEPTPAIMRFSLNDAHYREVTQGQRFQIMEGPRQVGAGIIISIDNN